MSVDMAKNVGLAVLAAVLLLGGLAVKLTKTVTHKAISLVVMLCLGLGVWTQRANVADCVDKVKAEAERDPLAVPSASCTFFGKEVDLKVR